MLSEWFCFYCCFFLFVRVGLGVFCGVVLGFWVGFFVVFCCCFFWGGELVFIKEKLKCFFLGLNYCFLIGEWFGWGVFLVCFFAICLTPCNCKYNVLSLSLSKHFFLSLELIILFLEIN